MLDQIKKGQHSVYEEEANHIQVLVDLVRKRLQCEVLVPLVVEEEYQPTKAMLKMDQEPRTDY